MQSAPKIAGDIQRLEALRRYELIDALPEQTLDELTALAAHVCSVPISMISLVEENRQWFKSMIGISIAEMPREISFCAHAIAQHDLFIVPDTLQDLRFADNPLVKGDPNIRFYAGAPLITPDGHAIGALCIVDRVPRKLEPSQQDALRMLGRQVMAQFELKRQARALANSEQLFRAIFDSEPECVKVLDRKGTLQMMNRAGLAMVEADSPDQIVGSCIYPLVASPHRGAFEALTDRVFEGRPGSTVFEIEGLKGAKRWLETHATPLRDASGTITGMLGVTRDITESRRAVAMLQEREEQMRLYAEHSPAAVAMFDREMRYIVVSRRWMEDYGLGEQSIVGRSHYEVFPEIPERWREVHRRCLAGAVEACEEDPFVRANGRTEWLRWEIRPWRGAGGSIGGIIIFTEDITARKAAEAAVRESEQQYRMLFASNPHPMWVYDLETLRFLAVNDAAVARYGYSREEFFALTIKDIRPEEDIPRLMENLRTSTAAFQDSGVWRHQKKDGSEIAVEITSHGLEFDGRRAELVLAVDVTSRIQTEKRIRALNRTYAVLSDINQTIVRERDTQVMLDAACLTAVEKGGFKLGWIGLKDSARGQLRITSHAGGSAETIRVLASLVEGEQPGCAFTSSALSTGRHGVCNDIAGDPECAPWRDEALARDFRSVASLPLRSGEGVVGTFNLYSSEPNFFDADELRLLDELAMDIAFALEFSRGEAERLRIESELRASESRFRALFEYAPDGIVIASPSGVYLDANPGVCRMFGYPRDEFIGMDTTQLAVRSEFVNIAPAMAALTRGRDYRREWQFWRKDGTEFVAEIIATAMPNGNIVAIFRDATEKRRLESQLRQSQKMEAIGQLAGGVAHDFNNILAAIMMQADLASNAGEMPKDTREMLDEIKAATERAANLTRQLLAFSRRQVLQTRILDLNEVVTNIAKMLQRILGEDIRLQFNLHPRPLLARADAGMLDQVLLNLVVNARDAMPHGGSLSIDTSALDLSEVDAAAIPDAKPGPHVHVNVTDTGTGIAPEHMSHIFEPFFTTKEPGKGTGLGLATVFGIVKQHGGTLRVKSEVGRGTSIGFMIPAIDIAESEASERTARRAPRGGTETILLVEDDPAVRMLTRMVLETKGYKIIEADSAPAALKAWDRAAGAIDLLFTDLVMPEGIGGHALAAELQALKPELKVIFTSGYSADIAGRELELKPGQNFIQKPSPPIALLEVVRQSLDS